MCTCKHSTPKELVIISPTDPFVYKACSFCRDPHPPCFECVDVLPSTVEYLSSLTMGETQRSAPAWNSTAESGKTICKKWVSKWGCCCRKNPLHFPKQKHRKTFLKHHQKTKKNSCKLETHVVYKYRVQLFDGYLLPDAIYPHWVVTFGSSKLRIPSSRHNGGGSLWVAKISQWNFGDPRTWRTWNETTKKNSPNLRGCFFWHQLKFEIIHNSRK